MTRIRVDDFIVIECTIMWSSAKACRAAKLDGRWWSGARLARILESVNSVQSSQGIPSRLSSPFRKDSKERGAGSSP